MKCNYFLGGGLISALLFDSLPFFLLPSFLGLILLSERCSSLAVLNDFQRKRDQSLVCFWDLDS